MVIELAQVCRLQLVLPEAFSRYQIVNGRASAYLLKGLIREGILGSTGMNERVEKLNFGLS